jgi:DnaJ-class molecular chaperone
MPTKTSKIPKVDCGNCKGKGRYYSFFAYGFKKCPKCKGTGKILWLGKRI